nr:RNA-directed DNA polymerase, eukaryota, reverse transcriptase zinc-binding domain protein [Tanacetum cinerariifolium]
MLNGTKKQTTPHFVGHPLARENVVPLGGSDVVNSDKEVRDEVNSMVNDKVADCDLEGELDIFNDGIGTDKIRHNGEEVSKSSFVKIVKPTLISQENKLNLVPTSKENGRDVVIFEEELVEEGRKIWFEGDYFTKWDISLQIQTWGRDGNLGKPLIMDKVTTQMFTEGTGRLGFARVLVEVNPKTDMKDIIKQCYINKNNETRGTKFVNVEYVWKPVRCSHCAVFGHDYSKCGFNPDKVKETVMPKSYKSDKDKRTDNEGFVLVRKNNAFKPNGNIGGRMQGMHKKTEFRPVKKEEQNNEAPKNNPLGKPDNIGKQTPTKEKEWNVPKNVIEAIIKSANKYSILEDQNEEENLEGINLEEKGIVDRFVKGMIQPNLSTTNVWSHAMVNYFKDQWEKINGREGIDVVEVMDNDNGMAKSIQSKQDPIRGILKKIDRVLGNSEFMDQWNMPIKGCNLYKLVKRTKNMTIHMKNLAWKKGSLFRETKEWKDKLKEFQTKVDAEPHNADLRTEETNILKEYCEAISDEENFLFRQAKIVWLKDEGMNTKFFHAYLKSRRNRSRITMIKNEKGESFINDKVPEQFVMHFKEFLGTSQPTQLDLLDKIDFDKTISNTDAEWMLRPVSNKEINQAMFDIDDNRAPGPDGFSSKFYKTSWDIIGNDVCVAVKEFFNKGKLLGELNATIISLIHKLETPTKVSDFRPIICCNVVYKCISKVLTERIKKALCYLVDPNQSAFLPGRQITDNIMLTQELLRGYDWKNGTQRAWLFQMRERIKAREPNLTLYVYHGDGDVKSVKVVKGALDHFCSIINDYKKLLDKIKERVLNWKNKMLAYARRLQLIASVLSAIYVYWASVFMLPKTVIKDIDKILKGFPWNQGDLKRGSAKVSWKVVCGFKSQGADTNASAGWKQILSLRDKNIGYDWEAIIDHASHWPNNKSILNVIKKISLAASVYFIWRERNKRLFAGEKKEWETVLNEVINTIRFKLISVKIKSSVYVSNIEKTWKIKMNVQSNDEGEGSTVLVESHHTPLDEVASIGVDVRHGGVTTTVSSLDAGQGSEVQGRYEQEIKFKTEDISTAETLVYIRRSASKDKGKGIMIESEPEQTTTKLQQRQERAGYEAAVRLQEQLDEEERQRIAKVKYPIIDWVFYIEESRKYWRIIRVGNHTETYQIFADMLKKFDRDNMVKLCDLVKERFSITKPIDDKEKELWVELKRLFKQDNDDTL